MLVSVKVRRGIDPAAAAERLKTGVRDQFGLTPQIAVLADWQPRARIRGQREDGAVFRSAEFESAGSNPETSRETTLRPGFLESLTMPAALSVQRNARAS